MKRTKIGHSNTSLRKQSRTGRKQTVLCMFIFIIICTNFVFILVFSATAVRDWRTNMSLVTSRELSNMDQSLSILYPIKHFMTRHKNYEYEELITIKVLCEILENIKRNDGSAHKNYIDAIIADASVTTDKRWLLSYCFNKEFNKEVSTLFSRTGNFISSTTKAVSVQITDVRMTKNKSDTKVPETTKIWLKLSFNNTMKTGSSKQEQKKDGLYQQKNQHTTTSILSMFTAESRWTPASETLKELSFHDTRLGVVVNTSEKLKHCLEYKKYLVGKIQPIMQVKSTQELANMFPALRKGGSFTPTDCIPKEKTAVIIPYRNRYSHLHILLLNILPVLLRQKIEFTIFVVEQQLPGIFNRGMLLNVGFLEALKLENFDCFIFHDVDLLPINDFHLYHCNDMPTHFVAGVNKFNYSLSYNNMFGGVVAFTYKQFTDINGASNLYFGWGGEDDDLRMRALHKRYTVLRADSKIGLYDMIRHKRDNKNNVNPLRGKLLKFVKERQDIEGLNTTVYRRHSVKFLHLYTWMKITINITDVLMTVPKNLDTLRVLMIRHFSEG